MEYKKCVAIFQLNMSDWETTYGFAHSTTAQGISNTYHILNRYVIFAISAADINIEEV